MVKKPVRSIVAAIAAAAARWSDAAFAPRVRARDAASARTGYSPAAVDFAFDALFGALRKDAIEAVVTDELGSPRRHSTVSSSAPGACATRALPIGRVCILSSRTTVGVAIVPGDLRAVREVRRARQGSRRRPGRGVFRNACRGAATNCATPRATRDRGTARRDARACTAFDAVVAFGDDATLRCDSRAALAAERDGSRYGSKASCGYVGRDALATPGGRA